jgi:hypothetical protein
MSLAGVPDCRLCLRSFTVAIMTMAAPAGVFVRIACAPCSTWMKQRRKNIRDLAGSTARQPVLPCRNAKNISNGNPAKAGFFSTKLIPSRKFAE